ncbi:hypothetical protein C7S16_2980 [Burkholderia thailandensis]|uniref:Uncharacterized protein n=1 Tax=Burkholderia thailandensis TaxID=57975 RepID=A0AAW9D3G8_BURTH|nr:hypothetical protein [Burkholderia thailandensis]
MCATRLRFFPVARPPAMNPVSGAAQGQVQVCGKRNVSGICDDLESKGCLNASSIITVAR